MFGGPLADLVPGASSDLWVEPLLVPGPLGCLTAALPTGCWDKGPGNRAVPLLEAQLRTWKEPFKMAVEVSPVRRQGEAASSDGAGILRDPSGCPPRAGVPCLPHPKQKFARTGTKATACNMWVPGTKHCR